MRRRRPRHPEYPLADAITGVPMESMEDFIDGRDRIDEFVAEERLGLVADLRKRYGIGPGKS